MEHTGKSNNGIRLVTPRRTITETDIVNFVSIAGLFEPPFIDMEWVKESTIMGRRFAPAPLLISIAMGLTALALVNPGKEWMDAWNAEGKFGGMVGLDVKIMRPTWPGDTLHVEVEIVERRKTSKGGTLIGIKHTVKNQRGEIPIEFVEKALFMPPES
jgi:acyl dehydratase